MKRAESWLVIASCNLDQHKASHRLSDTNLYCNSRWILSKQDDISVSVNLMTGSASEIKLISRSDRGVANIKIEIPIGNIYTFWVLH